VQSQKFEVEKRHQVEKGNDPCPRQFHQRVRYSSSTEPPGQNYRVLKYVFALVTSTQFEGKF